MTISILLQVKMNGPKHSCGSVNKYGGTMALSAWVAARAVDFLRPWTFSSGTSRGPAVNVVGDPGPSALAPPGGLVSMFSHLWWALPDLQLWHLPGVCRRCFHVDGGRSRTFSSGTSRGPNVDVFTLMVGAPRPSAPTPPRGPPSTFSR
jgi:hypothetical protein